MIEFLKPNVSDIASMQSLIQEDVKNGVILSRSNDEIANQIRSYTIIKNKDEIIGFASLYIYDEELSEIRSLFIKDDFRNQKLGSKLVKTLLEEAEKLQIKKVLVLTYRKDFFTKLNFLEIQKESIPKQKVWADCIKCKSFPICNEVSLIKNI
jgi:amino-acid N-acetyltransferase